MSNAIQTELFTPANIVGRHTETPVLGIATTTPSVVNSQPVVDLFQGQTASRMHAGKIETSNRLRATLQHLSDGAWHTTLEINRATGSMAVHSDIAALRANNIRVDAECAKGRVWKYRVAI